MVQPPPTAFTKHMWGMKQVPPLDVPPAACLPACLFQ